MTYEEALLYLEEATAQLETLPLNADKDLRYLVEAQVKQFASLVKAFEKHPDKKDGGCVHCTSKPR